MVCEDLVRDRVAKTIEVILGVKLLLCSLRDGYIYMHRSEIKSLVKNC